MDGTIFQMINFSRYDWSSAVVYLMCAAVITWLFNRFYTKKRPLDWGTYISLLVTHCMLFYMILLVTVDIAAGMNLCTEKTGGREDISCAYMIPFFFVVIYSILYWSVFVLSWVVLPYYQSWVLNGDFYFLAKVWGSLIDNIVQYLIYFGVLGGVGAIAVAYLLITNAFAKPEDVVTLNFETLAGLGMSASNAFGIVLMTFLVGHSVAAFPKYLFFQANDKKTLQYYQFQAVKLTEELDQAMDTLQLQLGELRKIDVVIKREPELQPYFDIMMKEANQVSEEYKKKLKQTDSPMEQLTYKGLVGVHANLMTAIRNVQAKENEWKALQNKAMWLEDVMMSSGSTEQRIYSPLFKKERSGTFWKIWDRIEFFFYTKFRVASYILVAIFSVIFSICLMWSQLAPFWKTVFGPSLGKKFSIFYLISHGLAMLPFSRIALQIFCIITVAIITWYCFFSLAQLKIPSMMTLTPYTTDASSLLFLTILLCRIAPTICYTYINMMGLSVDDGIAFSRVMGTLKTDKLKLFGTLGDVFGTYFPLFTFLVAVIELFDILPRLLACVNYKTFIFTAMDSGKDDDVETGKKLLDIERKRRMKQDYDVGAKGLKEEGDKEIEEKQKRREEKTKFGKKMRERREREAEKNKIDNSEAISLEDIGIKIEKDSFDF